MAACGALLQDEADQVVFPCDLPNWSSIRHHLLGLLAVSSPSSLVSRMHIIHQLIPVTHDEQEEVDEQRPQARRGNAFKVRLAQ